jgi:hypothetical protein
VPGQLAAMLRQPAEVVRRREREAPARLAVTRLVPGSTLERRPRLGTVLDRLRTIVDYRSAAIIEAEAEAPMVLE